MPSPRKKPSWSASMEIQLRAEVVICPTVSVAGAAAAGAAGGAAGGGAGGAAAGGAAAGGGGGGAGGAAAGGAAADGAAAGAAGLAGAQARSAVATNSAMSGVIVARSPAMGHLLRAGPEACDASACPAYAVTGRPSTARTA